MTKKSKAFLLTGLVLVLAALWMIRYHSINHYYQSMDKSRIEYYPMEQEVAFGTDFVEWQEPADGYYLKVDKFEIVNMDEYLANAPFEIDREKEPQSEGLALVYITLRNEDNEDDGVFLTSLVLHGLDTYEPMAWSILLGANPSMQGVFGIKLQPGAEAQFVLPYYIQRSNFGSDTWSNLENYSFFLRMTAFPTKKNIQLTLDEFSLG